MNIFVLGYVNSTGDIYGVVVTSAYPSRAEYAMQQCALSYFMDLRRGHCVPKIVEVFQCLTGVSEALLEYGGNIVSATLKCAGWCLVVEMPARWMS